jgi:hypothetical protein
MTCSFILTWRRKPDETGAEHLIQEKTMLPPADKKKCRAFSTGRENMVTLSIDTSSTALQSSSSRAATLGQDTRKELALEVLAHTSSVTEIAKANGVSRKFLYQQAERASTALEEAFADPNTPEEKILFELPVTKSWLRQFALGLTLICHSSSRGVEELCRDLLDTPLSASTVQNIIREAVPTARTINRQQDLSGIRIGAHDEIFQAGKPVLAGVDVDSTYCYLLSREEQRDAETWGIRLLELSDQGLAVEYTIADAGSGLRAGQQLAWPDIPCHGDVFHIVQDLERLTTYVTNRAMGAINTRESLERKMQRARKKKQGQKLSLKLAAARKAEAQAVSLADNVTILAGWLRHDILSVAGSDLTTRQELFDFIVNELQQLEPLCTHRIGPVRRALKNQRDQLLAFVGLLDEQFEQLATRFCIPTDLIHRLCELEAMDIERPLRWQRETTLRDKAGSRFHEVQQAMREAMEDVQRASSFVENLNSRLRNYFFLRKQIGPDYLELLQFFLNHRAYIRSRVLKRKGKTPAELLTGVSHPRWMELLGHKRFRRQVA